MQFGQRLEATVQLAKEYGLILDIPNQDDEESQLTGFIVNEQKKSSKEYK